MENTDGLHKFPVSGGTGVEKQEILEGGGSE